MRRFTGIMLLVTLALFTITACASPGTRVVVTQDSKGNTLSATTEVVEKDVTPTSAKLYPLPQGGWKLISNTSKYTQFQSYGAPGVLATQRTVDRLKHGEYDLTQADVDAGRDRGNFHRPADWLRARTSDTWAVPANSVDNVGVGVVKNDKEHSYVLFGLYYKPDDQASMATFNELVRQCGLDPATEAQKLDVAWAPPANPDPPSSAANTN